MKYLSLFFFWGITITFLLMGTVLIIDGLVILIQTTFFKALFSMFLGGLLFCSACMWIKSIKEEK